MNELVLIDDSIEVRKAQELVKSRYKLNPLALKLITTLIGSVQDSDEPNRVYKVRVKDFIDLQGLKGKDYYSKLDSATDEIMSKPIRIDLGGKDFFKANWCSSIIYRNGEGVIDFKISDELLPYIKDLKNNYLKYDLINILPLRSDYSVRIYEWLKDEFNKYGRYGKKAEVILTVDFIRERLEIPKSYTYKDIRRQIIDKAKEDLEKHCDIKFTWEVSNKIGRAVSHIKFKIYPNKKEFENEKLPAYLDTYLSYVNYLKPLYSGNSGYFIVLNIDIGNGINGYYFGINKDGYVFATPVTGGDSIRVNKSTAEKVLSASYTCSLHSEVYRDFISNKSDIWELSKDLEHKDYWGVLKKEIVEVIKNHDIRVKRLF